MQQYKDMCCTVSTHTPCPGTRFLLLDRLAKNSIWAIFIKSPPLNGMNNIWCSLHRSVSSH